VPHVAQLLGLAVLACYLSGFLTVNTYLARFGIFDTDPLKAAYLTVGATFFAISGMYFYAAGVVLVRWGHFERNLQVSQQQAGLSGPLWASASKGCVLARFFGGAAFTLMMCEFLLSPRWEPLLLLVAASWVLGESAYQIRKRVVSFKTELYFALFNGVFAIGILANLDGLGNGLLWLFNLLSLLLVIYSSVRRRFEQPAVPTFYLAAVFVLMAPLNFGVFTYPSLRASFGGPSQDTVMVVLVVDAIPHQAALKVGLSGDTISDARIITEGPTSISIIVPSHASPERGAVVRLERSAVTAVIRPPAQTDFAK
jgi:hypothetical protein